eukprot:NODE_463_length_1646_cov_351.912962_g352_i0.p1 GENE.NODE_463_length_1646_cov_351.912962_g352_i0~~NODE_463_length_1646_cov_351.912962_g352_i0.p1  ORF type:complete len:505 (+),score=91.99 NODE_463_length_1646_cov_351.912962_g352_i0:63-1517(+)
MEPQHLTLVDLQPPALHHVAQHLLDFRQPATTLPSLLQGSPYLLTPLTDCPDRRQSCLSPHDTTTTDTTDTTDTTTDTTDTNFLTQPDLASSDFRPQVFNNTIVALHHHRTTLPSRPSLPGASTELLLETTPSMSSVFDEPVPSLPLPPHRLPRVPASSGNTSTSTSMILPMPVCPSCSHPFYFRQYRPHILSCGHTICRTCLILELSAQPTCSVCGLKVSRRPILNVAVLQITNAPIDDWRPNQCSTDSSSSLFCCFICLESYCYVVPRVLNCGHCFCETCITRTVDRWIVDCSFCHHPTLLSDSRPVANLPINHLLVELASAAPYVLPPVVVEDELPLRNRFCNCFKCQLRVGLVHQRRLLCGLGMGLIVTQCVASFAVVELLSVHRVVFSLRLVTSLLVIAVGFCLQSKVVMAKRRLFLCCTSIVLLLWAMATVYEVWFISTSPDMDDTLYPSTLMKVCTWLTGVLLFFSAYCGMCYCQCV